MFPPSIEKFRKYSLSSSVLTICFSQNYKQVKLKTKKDNISNQEKRFPVQKKTAVRKSKETTLNWKK